MPKSCSINYLSADILELFSDISGFGFVNCVIRSSRQFIIPWDKEIEISWGTMRSSFFMFKTELITIIVMNQKSQIIPSLKVIFVS